MKKIVGILAGVLFVTQVWAGLTFTSVIKAEGGNATPAEMQSMATKAQVEGSKARTAYTQTGVTGLVPQQP